MREQAAKALAARAKPCPFCGEKLRTKNDHHGWWVAHALEAGACLVAFNQIHTEANLREWNTRPHTPEPENAEDRAVQKAKAMSDKCGIPEGD